MDPMESRQCPDCGRLSALDARACACGHQFPTPFAAYPRFGPGSVPMSMPRETDLALKDLAWHYRLWYNRSLTYLFVGFLCGLPWIVSLLAYLKLRTIRRQVLALGVDIDWWAYHYLRKGKPKR